MILVDSNPLEDLSALEELYGVMARGTWYGRKTLDRLLDGVACKMAEVRERG